VTVYLPDFPFKEEVGFESPPGYKRASGGQIANYNIATVRWRCVAYDRGGLRCRHDDERHCAVPPRHCLHGAAEVVVADLA